MKMKHTFFQNFATRLSLIVLVFAFGLSSCNPASDDQDSEKDSLAQDSLVEAQANVEPPKEIEYPLNTPVEISSMLNNAGASYIFLCNAPENVDRYLTDQSRAINLGVYGADLAYVSTYNKKQETHNYLDVSKSLTEQLGISSVFDENLMQRIEQNIENKDSLHTIISNSFEQTYQALQENGKGHIAVIVLAGGWIEGLYIAGNLAQNSMDNKEILLGIAEQKVNLDKLTLAMEVYKDHENVKAIYQDIQKIKTFYEGISVNEPLSAGQLEELNALAQQIRSKLVE